MLCFGRSPYKSIRVIFNLYFALLTQALKCVSPYLNYSLLEVVEIRCHGLPSAILHPVRIPLLFLVILSGHLSLSLILCISYRTDWSDIQDWSVCIITGIVSVPCVGTRMCWETKRIEDIVYPWGHINTASLSLMECVRVSCIIDSRCSKIVVFSNTF